MKIEGLLRLRFVYIDKKNINNNKKKHIIMLESKK